MGVVTIRINRTKLITFPFNFFGFCNASDGTITNVTDYQVSDSFVRINVILQFSTQTNIRACVRLRIRCSIRIVTYSALKRQLIVCVNFLFSSHSGKAEGAHESSYHQHTSDERLRVYRGLPMPKSLCPHPYLIEQHMDGAFSTTQT